MIGIMIGRADIAVVVYPTPLSENKTRKNEKDQL